MGSCLTARSSRASAVRMEEQQERAEQHVKEEREYDVAMNAMVFPVPQEEPEKPFELDEDGHVRWELPVHVEVEVWPKGGTTECFLIASQDKKGWGGGGDGLTVTSCVNRDDFTFRAEVFGKFPAVEVHHSQRLRMGEWNHFALTLSEQRATYWINHVRIATCNFKPGDLPTTRPFIGLYGFTSTYRARRFRASREPDMLAPILDRVLTLSPAEKDGQLYFVCTALSGEEVACVGGIGPRGWRGKRMLFEEVQTEIAKRLSTAACCLKLLFPDGTLMPDSLADRTAVDIHADLVFRVGEASKAAGREAAQASGMEEANPNSTTSAPE